MCLLCLPGPILSPENAKMYNSSLQDGLFAPEVLEEIGKVRLNYTDPAGGLLFMGIFVSAADGAVREMIRKVRGLIDMPDWVLNTQLVDHQ